MKSQESDSKRDERIEAEVCVGGEDAKLMDLRMEGWARSQGEQMAWDTGKDNIFPGSMLKKPVLPT